MSAAPMAAAWSLAGNTWKAKSLETPSPEAGPFSYPESTSFKPAERSEAWRRNCLKQRSWPVWDASRYHHTFMAPKTAELNCCGEFALVPAPLASEIMLSPLAKSGRYFG